MSMEADQNLRMANKMLEQQGELNRVKAERDDIFEELKVITAERDEAQNKAMELANELSDTQTNFADYRHGAEAARAELVNMTRDRNNMMRGRDEAEAKLEEIGGLIDNKIGTSAGEQLTRILEVLER